MSGASLTSQLGIVPQKAPCDNCPDREACKNDELACMSFANFVATGYPKTRRGYCGRAVDRRKYPITDNIPSKAIYALIFREEDRPFRNIVVDSPLSL